MSKHIALTTTIAVAALLALAGCGGGGGTDDDDSGAGNNGGQQTEVPDSAMASGRSFAEFIAALRPSDTSQPLAMNTRWQPPTSDSDSPVDVD
jgi:hypothetical protein